MRGMAVPFRRVRGCGIGEGGQTRGAELRAEQQRQPQGRGQVQGHQGQRTGAAAKAGFAVTSVMGLVLNEGLMLLFRVMLGEDAVLLTLLGYPVTMYMLNKVLSTLLVMVWNYFTKKAVLQSGLIQRLLRHS